MCGQLLFFFMVILLSIGCLSMDGVRASSIVGGLCYKTLCGGGAPVGKPSFVGF